MIYIFDDDIAVQTSLKLLLSQAGYKCKSYSYPMDAMKDIKDEIPELILLDMNFSNDTSGSEGLMYLKDFKTRLENIPIILITAWATIPLAVEGVKKGAFDFISKPWDNSSVLKTVETALNLNSDHESSSNRKELDEKYNFSHIIGESDSMIKILETIGRVSKTDAPVLILGESGTGKELIAEAIHANSKRKDNEFVKVNLGGISSSLFESEMFGHKKGAFTDAYTDRKGRFELADKGSIFLDEIGDLDYSSQVKLLRVLQDKTYQVLGDSKTRKTDTRIICATNRNLKEMVEDGNFREDLLYRINLITINLPSLRDRYDDIPSLVDFFIENIKNEYGLESLSVNDSAIKMLKTFPFSGNIRELKNLIERTYLMSGNSVLNTKDFKAIIKQEYSGSALNNKDFNTVDDMEKRMIEEALAKFDNNISKTAKSLGLSRGAFYRRLEKYNIKI